VKRSAGAGFTLIEVLVALFVLAVAVVAVLQLFGGGLRLARASADQVAATLLASAKLSELALEPLEEGETEGTDGPYGWSRRVTLEPKLLPVEPTLAPVELPVNPGERRRATLTPGGAPQSVTTVVRLARVTVEVRWGKDRRVELTTLRAWSEKS